MTRYFPGTLFSTWSVNQKITLLIGSLDENSHIRYIVLCDGAILELSHSQLISLPTLEEYEKFVKIGIYFPPKQILFNL